ncbi:uncharacterized protein LOC143846778 isoform X2 [Tasmannia lanceolata]|uniref:uncharacterized protein LOC143846778 isoform X2 n=1 Tax=Tasmannia lanceolata TaxID=3420 RepID=UPI004062B4E7
MKKSCIHEADVDPCPRADAEGGTQTVQEVLQNEKLDKVPKIKWGDLEDDALELHICHGLSDASKTSCGDISDDHLAGHGNLENANGSVSHVSSYAANQEEKTVLISEDANLFPEGRLVNTDDSVSLVPSDDATKGEKEALMSEEAKQFSNEMAFTVRAESIKENCKEANEISSDNLELSSSDGKLASPINDDENLEETHHKCLEPSCNEARDDPDSNDPLKMVSPIKDDGNLEETRSKCLDPSRNEPGNDPDTNDPFTENRLPSIVEIGMLTTPQVPPNDSKDGSVDISEILVINQVSKSQFMGAIAEAESGECKERFRQRLWCFLFENLNRAVDELYLLCELECDVDQMKEAILVLEEAASDFRELKSRVDGFENPERSPSQTSQDGTPVNMKTDHRRPHALSWEVRRMTTSPHRAEILSSSLEAFKKIQQERASRHLAQGSKGPVPACPSPQHVSTDLPRKLPGRGTTTNAREPRMKSRKQTGILGLGQGNTGGEKRNLETNRLSKALLLQNSRPPSQGSSASDSIASQVALKDDPAISAAGKCKKEPLGSISEIEKQIGKKDTVLTESKVEKYPKSTDTFKRQNPHDEKEKEKEKRNTASWKAMDAWKEKRNWEDILSSPLPGSFRVSHSPGMRRKSVERARVLHDKLMSPEKKKKTALDMKRDAEEKHARAMRIRGELENERVQRLQRTSEKLSRVNEWQAVRSLKLREGMYARHQRSESRHEAHLAQVVRRAGDESSKVNEVRFITSLNDENKKLMLRQRLHDSELRRAEKLQVIRTKQKEDLAREEAVLERRKLLEAEKLQRLAETQRKKEEAQVRREEERKASSAAREAKTVEQLRRKEVRAKAQLEEAELLAQKLAERLSESEQRRKFYLEQIREKASMEFRDQSSPSLKRSSNKEGQGRSVSTNSLEDYQTNCLSGVGSSGLGLGSAILQHSLKRRIKKIRQRLMALKYEFNEPPVGAEGGGIGYRTQVGAARAKIGRWLQDLQRLRQARKEGAASIGLIVCDMIKFLEGKDPELNASRQAGLIDFIASALPASHTSRPENCQVTIYLLRLLRVVLSVPANRSYFLAQNLLPPIIPMLSAALENYIKIAASLNLPGGTIMSSKTSVENLESMSEVLDGFLWTVTAIIGHIYSDENRLQMQDGLTELVIAYQVIHRLRDLFALYDRPQLEGSPFPSSILLSLNLLAVLTSRSGTISSIDWGLYLSKDSVGVGDLFVINATCEHSRIPSTQQHVITDIPLNGPGQINGEEMPNVSKNRPLDEPCTSRYENPLSSGGDSGEVPTDISVKFDNVGASSQRCTTCISSESQKSTIEEHAKTLSWKDDKGKNEISAEQSTYLKNINDLSEHAKNENRQGISLKQPAAFLVSAISETGLVSLPSLLTAVLLQANNKLSSEQGVYILPSNFEEVATGVLKVLNNLALMDITILQSMLARPDLKMEFFHLMSFLLSHCTSKWKTATDQVGLLLLESLLLLGYFSLFHHGNQAVLRWGKSPTILHKVCDLPFVFFSDPELMPILAGTLVAACYGCEQNRGVLQQELSMDMLLSLLKSCRQGILTVQSESSPTKYRVIDDPCDVYQSAPEPRKHQVELSGKSNRSNQRSTRVLSGKGGVLGSNGRVGKVKNLRDSKGTKTCDDWAFKHNLPSLEPSSTFMLHSRFPSSFIDKAVEFFSAGIPNV